MLKIDEEGVKLVGDIFEIVSRGMGIDGRRIFDKVAAGAPFSEALSITPEALELLYARAHQCFAAGRVDKAEQLFRSLCVLDGDRVDFLLGYGICLRFREDYGAAAVMFETVALMRPEWAIPYYHLLEQFIHRKKWSEAKEALASFDIRAGERTEEAINTEVERFRKAIEIHAEQDRARRSPGPVLNGQLP